MLITNRKGGRGVRAVLAGAVAFGVLSAASSAMAAGILTAQDLDLLDPDLANAALYTQVASLGPNNFVPNVGNISGTAYLDLTNGDYVYRLEVQSAATNLSEFNTSFEVLGLGGADPVAGYSFGDSTTVFGNDHGLVIEFDPDGTIDWNRRSPTQADPNGFWENGETLAFFFRDPREPSLGNYNLINGVVGTVGNLAPVPEPGSIALMGLGLVGLVGLVRRRRKATVQESTEA